MGTIHGVAWPPIGAGLLKVFPQCTSGRCVKGSLTSKGAIRPGLRGVLG